MLAQQMHPVFLVLSLSLAGCSASAPTGVPTVTGQGVTGFGSASPSSPQSGSATAAANSGATKTQGAAVNSTATLPSAPGVTPSAPSSGTTTSSSGGGGLGALIGSLLGGGSSSATSGSNASGTTPAGATAPVAGKKGSALWYFGGVDTALSDVRASWFYTWRANYSGITPPSGLPFVPMIWGPSYVDASDLSAAKAAGDTLLGFNEPDHPDQSNMTVQQALSLWPQLVANGQRLGAPATANDPSQSGSWLEQFMAGAKTAGYRVDFICLHWYGSGTDPVQMTAALQTYVQNAYAKYQLPIWITEYSLINYDGGAQATPEQEAAFATASMAMLDSLPYVERYSWYATPPQGNYSLYNEDGTETVVGTAYKAGS